MVDMERDAFVQMMIQELEQQRAQDAASFERGWRPHQPCDMEARPVFDKLKFDFAEPDSTELRCLTQAMSFHLDNPTSTNQTIIDQSALLLPDGWQLNHNFLYNLQNLATRQQPKASNTVISNKNDKSNNSNTSQVVSTTVAEEAGALAVISLLHILDRVLSAQHHCHVFPSLSPLLASAVTSYTTASSEEEEEEEQQQQQQQLNTSNNNQASSSWDNVLSCVLALCALVSYDVFSALSQERWDELDVTDTLLSIAKRLRMGQGGGVLTVSSYAKRNESMPEQLPKDGDVATKEEHTMRGDGVTNLRSMWPRFMFILRDRIIHRPKSVASIVPALFRCGDWINDERASGKASERTSERTSQLSSSEANCSDICDPMVVSMLAELVRNSDFVRAPSHERGVAWDILFNSRQMFVRSFTIVTLAIAASERRQQQKQKLVKAKETTGASEEKGTEVTATADAAAEALVVAERSAQHAELCALVAVLEFVSNGDPRSYNRVASQQQSMAELVTLGVVRTALTAWLSATDTSTSVVIGRFLMSCARRSRDVTLFLLKVPAVYKLVMSSVWIERSSLSDRILCPLTLACAGGPAAVTVDINSKATVEALIDSGLGCAMDVLKAYTDRETEGEGRTDTNACKEDIFTDKNETNKNKNDNNNNKNSNVNNPLDNKANNIEVRDAMEVLMALDDDQVVICLAHGPSRVVTELTLSCKAVELSQRKRLSANSISSVAAASPPLADAPADTHTAADAPGVPVLADAPDAATDAHVDASIPHTSNIATDAPEVDSSVNRERSGRNTGEEVGERQPHSHGEKGRNVGNDGDGYRGKLELADRHVRITALVKRVLGRLDRVQGRGNKAD